MNTYTVIWHYIANFGTITGVRADSPEQAIEAATGHFSDEFRLKGNVFVFDSPPSGMRLSEIPSYREKVQEHREW